MALAVYHYLYSQCNFYLLLRTPYNFSTKEPNRGKSKLKVDFHRHMTSLINYFQIVFLQTNTTMI